jgi:hypothetical protein
MCGCAAGSRSGQHLDDTMHVLRLYRRWMRACQPGHEWRAKRKLVLGDRAGSQLRSKAANDGFDAADWAVWEPWG